MISEITIKQIFTFFVIILLLFFSFLIIKPIFIPIIIGLILAYIFSPIENFIFKKIKNKTVSSFITCALVLSSLILLLWFALPVLIEQIFNSYVTIQSFDLITYLKKTFPPLFSSPQMTANIASTYNSFIANSANNALSKLTNILMELPSIILKLVVVLITFFYGLRDGDKIINLVKDNFPFNKSVTNKFIHKSQLVTFSVVYGRVVIGIITGTLAGIGFYFAGVPNALLLSVLTMFVSFIPLVGPWIIWIPVVIGLFFAGNIPVAIGLSIYCLLVVTLFENLATPIFVSKKSEIPTSLTLLSLIGGILVFGILGIILGPLIVAYLIILFEVYKEANEKNT